MNNVSCAARLGSGGEAWKLGLPFSEPSDAAGPRHWHEEWLGSQQFFRVLGYVLPSTSSALGGCHPSPCSSLGFHPTRRGFFHKIANSVDLLTNWA